MSGKAEKTNILSIISIFSMISEALVPKSPFKGGQFPVWGLKCQVPHWCVVQSQVLCPPRRRCFGESPGGFPSWTVRQIYMARQYNCYYCQIVTVIKCHMRPLVLVPSMLTYSIITTSCLMIFRHLPSLTGFLVPWCWRTCKPGNLTGNGHRHRIYPNQGTWIGVTYHMSGLCTVRAIRGYLEVS